MNSPNNSQWQRSDRRPANRRAPGFTLIELLVVIAIIAILAAMLLPALQHAKAKAQSTFCVNNLKELGVANRMYTDDFNDFFAFPNWDAGNPAAPQGWLYATMASQLPAGAPTGIPDPVDPGWWYQQYTTASGTGLWYRYTASPKVYLCPVDITSASYTTPGGRPNKLSTYVMNGAVENYPGNASGWPAAIKMSSVWSPMCYLVWEPDEFTVPVGQPSEYNDGANDPTVAGQSIGLLHSKHGGNALALDGHVDFVTTKQFTTYIAQGKGPGPGGRTYLLWDTADAAGHP